MLLALATLALAGTLPVHGQSMYRYKDPATGELVFTDVLPRGNHDATIRAISPGRTAGTSAEEQAEQRRQRRLDTLASTGYVEAGMNADQVMHAWGEPNDTASRQTDAGRIIMWRYGRKFLYFEAGEAEPVLTDIDDLDRP